MSYYRSNKDINNRLKQKYKKDETNLEYIKNDTRKEEMKWYSDSNWKAFTNFHNTVIGNIRCAKDKDDRLWFVARDLCESLYQNNTSAALKRVKDKDKCECFIPCNTGLDGSRKMIMISEEGMYDLVFKSRMPFAVELQHWITHECLHAIRRSGGYILSQEELNLEKKLELNDIVSTFSKTVDKYKNTINNFNEKWENSHADISSYKEKELRNKLNTNSAEQDIMYEKLLDDFTKLYEENQQLKKELKLKENESQNDISINKEVIPIKADYYIDKDNFLVKSDLRDFENDISIEQDGDYDLDI